MRKVNLEILRLCIKAKVLRADYLAGKSGAEEAYFDVLDAIWYLREEGSIDITIEEELSKTAVNSTLWKVLE